MSLRKISNHPLLERNLYDKDLLTKMARDYCDVSVLIIIILMYQFYNVYDIMFMFLVQIMSTIIHLTVRR